MSGNVQPEAMDEAMGDNANDPGPFQPKDETGNAPPGAMDEEMDDDTKNPGPFQQRGPPTAEPQDAIAGSMEVAMGHDRVAPTASTPTPVT